MTPHVNLKKKYNEIGFIRLRNRPNDEVLMALAMQLHGQVPVADDGTIMSDPQACPGNYVVNVIKGKTKLTNPPLPHPAHQSWYPFTEVSPLVVHFLGDHTRNYPYKKEAYRLEMKAAEKSGLITEVKALVIFQLPKRLKHIIKNIFRPVYRFFFGTRGVDQSERIV